MVPREVRYVKTVALCHSSCTTNGRTWCTVAGNHKPYGSRRAHPRCSLSLSVSLRFSLSDVGWLSFSLTASPSISPGMHFTWHSAGFCPSPGFSRSLSLSLWLYLSIVHNYTIRLLNRLMRPLLPALAAPFTETTGRARASLHSLLLLSPSLIFPLFMENSHPQRHSDFLAIARYFFDIPYFFRSEKVAFRRSRLSADKTARVP